MRAGVLLPRHAGKVAAAARMAEQVGFDSVWCADSRNRGVMITDPFVALGIAAASTSRIELATSIVQVPLYAALQLASVTASLAAASEGRFVLGAGAGSSVADFHAFGVDFDRRFSMLDTKLAAVRSLLRGEEVEGARLDLWPELPRTHVLVGAWSAGRWLEKAATSFDGWIASAHSTPLPDLVVGLRRFRELGGQRAVAANLDLSRPDVTDVLSTLAEAGFDDVSFVLKRHDLEEFEFARSLCTR